MNADLFHEDRQMNRHDEANNRFIAILRKRLRIYAAEISRSNGIPIFTGYNFKCKLLKKDQKQIKANDMD